jgi:ankyrin repeat protein
MEAGANKECRSAEGRTPLHYAAYKQHLEVVRLFLQRDVDVNPKNNVRPKAHPVTLKAHPLACH